MTCDACGCDFEAVRRARWCSERCRGRARRHVGRKPDTAPTPDTPGPVTAACRSELERHGRQHHPLAAVVMAIAARIDGDDGFQLAPLSRELRVTLAEVLRDASAQADPIDEIKARRERRRIEEGE